MRLQLHSSGKKRKTAAPRLILGAALALGLTTTTQFAPANAANLSLGGIDIQIDTTVSLGATFLMSERDAQFLPIANGGPADGQTYINLGADGQTPLVGGTTPSAVDRETCSTGLANQYGGFCQRDTNVPNFDGSINTDDGRLNFDDGDIVSAPFKITSEIEADFGSLRAFARVNAFYDAALMDDGSFERGGLNDKGQSRAGQNLQLLDAYLDYEGDLGDMPFTLRVGRQVINWGEATFIPGGNSAFSPIDVAAIRRPGAEIKEALLPVEALYGSIALTQDVTLEAYIGGWDDYRLDGRGELWRIQEIGQAPDYRPEASVCWTVGGEFIYDLLAGRYMAVGMKSQRPANFVTGLERLTPDYYTPANVRRLGR